MEANEVENYRYLNVLYNDILVGKFQKQTSHILKNQVKLLLLKL